MTNCCGQQPLLFVVLWYACLDATLSVLVRVHLNACLILYKSSALYSYDNWMLWSICVLVVHFPLASLMACYLSKPVFKRFIMGLHMHHPLTLSAALYLSQVNNVKVFLKVIFCFVKHLSYLGMSDGWWVQTWMYWETYVAELIERFQWKKENIRSCHSDALCLNSRILLLVRKLDKNWWWKYWQAG